MRQEKLIVLLVIAFATLSITNARAQRHDHSTWSYGW